MEDVTAAVHEIDRHCPDALVRNGDTIDVDVDRLNAWTFCSVERVVAPQAAMRRAARSTARRTRKKRPATRCAGNNNSSALHVAKAARGGDGDCEGQVEAVINGAGRPYKKAKAARGGDGDCEGQVEAVIKGAGRPCKKAKAARGGDGDCEGQVEAVTKELVL